MAVSRFAKFAICASGVSIGSCGWLVGAAVVVVVVVVVVVEF